MPWELGARSLPTFGHGLGAGCPFTRQNTFFFTVMRLLLPLHASTAWEAQQLRLFGFTGRYWNHSSPSAAQSPRRTHSSTCSSQHAPFRVVDRPLSAKTYATIPRRFANTDYSHHVENSRFPRAKASAQKYINVLHPHSYHRTLFTMIRTLACRSGPLSASRHLHPRIHTPPFC